MKRILKIIGAIVIVIAIPAIIQKVMMGGKADENQAALAKMADEFNATLPKTIDRYFTVTCAEIERDIWRIHITVDPRAPIDPYQQKQYKDIAVQQICGSEMKVILRKKIAIEYLYTYTDSAGEQKLRISIPPGSC